MAKETRQTKKTAGKRILFVEDDAVVVSVYRSRLENEGFTVDVVEDGAAATQYLANEKPDLVILDLMLPKVNGLDVLKFIRSKPQLSTLPVVVLSNAYLADMVKKAMLAGANKPLFKTQCTPAMLAEVVRSFLPQEAEAVKGVRPAEEVDRESIARARKEFLARLTEEAEKIRRLAITYIKNANQPAGASSLSELYQTVHFVSARAGLIGLSRLAILTSAFEALLFELVFKPGTVTASVLQTIAQTTDCLKRLVERVDEDSPGAALQARVLVVDDDAVCNHVMVTALQRANLEAVGVKDPRQALDLLQRERFDLVLLDIRMPGMDGFDVCKRIRQHANQRTTPVVFVTANADFENRVQSVLSGGNEFIAKPVSPMELALKTITLLLDAKLKSEAEQTEAAREQGEVGSGTKEPVAAGAAASGGNGAESDIVAEVEDEAQMQEPAEVAAKDTRGQASQPSPKPVGSAPGLGGGRVDSYAKNAMPAGARGQALPMGRSPVEAQATRTSQQVPSPAQAAQVGGGAAGVMPGLGGETRRGIPMPSAKPAFEAPVHKQEPVLDQPEVPAAEESQMVNGVEAQPATDEYNDYAPEVRDQVGTLEEAEMTQSDFPEAEGEYGAMAGADTTYAEDAWPGQAGTESVAGPEPLPEQVIEDQPLTNQNVQEYMQPVQGSMQTMPPKGMGQMPVQGQQRLDRSLQADGSEAFDRLVRGVAEIIFGEENLNEINIRLVRFALERYGIKEMMRQVRPPHA